MSGNIVELFSSVQGEGKYIGYRQLFLRLSGCNLSCTYCDTPGSHLIPAQARFETQPGSGLFLEQANPLSLSEVIAGVRNLLTVAYHSLSLTGGEPLCQITFLQTLLPELRRMIPIYLETNGTLYEELKLVLPWVDYISMDIKLPSMTGQNSYAAHAKFIQAASQKDLFIKMVISDQSNVEEWDEAFATIAAVNPKLPLILQPVTPVGPHGSPSGSALLQLQARALHYLQDVRVIPQTHPMLAVL